MGPQQFTQWCAALDVELLSVEQCAELVDQLAVAGKACDAARARAAARAAAGAAALVPEVGAAVRSRLEAETETLRRQARRDGTEQAWEAHAADALANLILGQPASPTRPIRTDVVLVCDINAYRRGTTQHGEVS